jgi:hypothetical protein
LVTKCRKIRVGIDVTDVNTRDDGRSTRGALMKFVILIHSNPQPWGHPTSDFLAEHQALPAETRTQLSTEWEAVMAQAGANGEIIGAEALADPKSATLIRWQAGKPMTTDGPYAETKEQFAGFFMIDVANRERAEEIARAFCGPGETIELRPAMWPGGNDQ